MPRDLGGRLAWTWRRSREAAVLAHRLAGVWNWRGRIGKTEAPRGGTRDVHGVIPDLQNILGRTASNVAFDANARTNEEVKRARHYLAGWLAGRGAKVKLATCRPRMVLMARTMLPGSTVRNMC